MLSPGTSITHAAMRSLAETGCQVTWTYGDHRRTFAGVIHTGTATAYIRDIADLYRIHTVIPTAFEVAAQHADPGWDPDAVRSAARSALRERLVEHRVLPAVITDVDKVMDFHRGAPDAVDDAEEDRLAGFTLRDLEVRSTPGPTTARPDVRPRHHRSRADGRSGRPFTLVDRDKARSVRGQHLHTRPRPTLAATRR